ncbi:MAG: LTA synthase family protein [Muribaculaceae bacterium]|nr:LTA synthase family protein [Muribaculaceae bacterium]
MKYLQRFVSAHAATLFGILVWLLLSMELLALHKAIRTDFVFVHTVMSLSECALIMLPYWWLRGRMRAAVLVLAWGFSILMLCEIIYYRFWNQLIPLNLFSQAANANGILLGSAIGKLRRADLMFAAGAVVPTALYCLPAVRRAVTGEKYTLRMRIGTTALICLAFATVQVAAARRVLRDDHHRPHDFINAVRSICHEYAAPNAFHVLRHYTNFSWFGLLPQYIMEISDHIRAEGEFTLTDSERAGISRYLSGHEACPIRENRGKNLVFIIVESLDAEVIGLTVNGAEITPVMNALAADSTSLCSTAMLTQAGIGVSSDGQLIYNTGLLPLRRQPAAANIVPELDRLPAFASRFDDSYTCVAVFTDDGVGWNKNAAYGRYGYDRVITSDAYKPLMQAAAGPDGALLQYAAALADTLAQPFYMQLLTIQMHDPYVDKGFRPAADYSGTGISAERQRYLNCTAEFDRELGRFIDSLRHSGLWDNTVLAIASDHCSIPIIKADGEPGRIVFIAAGCGRGMRVEHTTQQVDVFPTLLDIMGVDSDYRGVGRSMLCAASAGTSDTRRASVSDSILRSDYFRAAAPER